MADSARYRWVLLAASTLALLTNASLPSSSGVFHVAFLEKFPDVSTSSLVLIGSVYLSAYGPASPIAGLVASVFDCRTCVLISGVLGIVGYSTSFFVTDHRWLFLTYSIIAGSGVGFASVGSMLATGYHFTEKASLASGILLTGNAMGIFIFPPLLQYFMDNYGLRGAFLLTGGVAAQPCFLGLLLRRSEFESTQKRNRVVTSRRLKWENYLILFKNRSFVIFCFSAMMSGMAMGSLYLYLPNLMVENGINKETSAMAMSLSGIGSCMSRLLSGMLAQHEDAGYGLVYSSLCGLVGLLSMSAKMFTDSQPKALVFGFLIGLYSGGTQSPLTAIVLEVVKVDLFSYGIGFALLSRATGYLLGPLIANIASQATENYNFIFITAGIMFLAASISGFLVTILQMKIPKRVNEHLLRNR